MSLWGHFMRDRFMVTKHEHHEDAKPAAAPFGSVSGGQAPPDAPREVPQTNFMKYDKEPEDKRVPDENNGPMIGESPEDYEKRKGRADKAKE